MYTTTAKTVLTPLADAVSQLILIVSTSEMNHTPLPPLTHLARIVNEQIQNLVVVGMKISAQVNADETLRLAMPSACQEAASGLLVDGAEDLKNDAVSGVGKSKLLKSASGILSGTTAVLNAFDDFEVRKIVKLAAEIQQKGELIAKDITLVDPTTLITLVKAVAQMMGTLAQITIKRIGELLSLNHQARLKNAVAVITRESPVLVETLKILVKNQKSKAGMRAKEQACVRINGACYEIARVVMIRGDAQSTEISLLSKNSLPIRMQHLDEMKNKVLNSVNDTEATTESLQISTQAYEYQATLLLQSAEQTISTMALSRSPNETNFLKKKLQTLTNHVEKANSIQLELVRHNEPDTQSMAVDILTNTSRALQRFHNEIDNEILADFMDALNSISDSNASFTAFGTAVKESETGVMSDGAREEFLAACQGLVGLMGSLADRIAPGNELLANEVMLRKAALVGLVPGLVSAMEVRSGDKKDESGKALLGTLVGMWEADVKALQGVVYDAFDGVVVVVGTELAASRLLRKLGGLKSSDQANEALGNLSKLKTQYATFLGKEIEIASDAGYKQVLQENMLRLEEAHLAELQLIVDDKEFDPSQLTNAVRGLTDVLSTIGASLRRPAQELVISPNKMPVLPELPQSLAIQIEQLRIEHAVNEIDLADTIIQLYDQAGPLEPIYQIPLLFTKEEEQAAPIAAAAREIIVESSRWIEQGNTLIIQVNTIAASMTALSHFHNELKKNSDPTNKSGFITASHDIIIQVALLVTYSQNIAMKCTDTRLRAQLLNTLDQITSIASQLKIVAAVKAASPNDTDKDLQLIVCAQNLVKAVKACIVECESCSIRQGVVAVETSKETKAMFRRTIYRKQLHEKAVKRLE